MDEEKKKKEKRKKRKKKKKKLNVGGEADLYSPFGWRVCICHAIQLNDRRKENFSMPKLPGLATVVTARFHVEPHKRAVELGITTVLGIL